MFIFEEMKFVGLILIIVCFGSCREKGGDFESESESEWVVILDMEDMVLGKSLDLEMPVMIVLW